MKKNKPSTTAYGAFEWLDSVIFSLSIVLLIFTFVIKTYTVQGSSMEPMFFTGNQVFAVDFLYTPKQGDVVIIDENNGLAEPLIKRVAALEGQTVEINARGEVLVDGVPFEQPIAANEANLAGDMSYPVTVPEGHIFVLGDNREVSLDSRYTALGFVDMRSVVGREIIKLG